MSKMIDLEKLECVVTTGDKTVARCPACYEDGADETGNHLVIYADGRYGCIDNQGEDGKEHRARIMALVGVDATETPKTPAPKVKISKIRKTYPTIDGAIQAAKWGLQQKDETQEWTEVRRDMYQDAAGSDVAAVVRFDRKTLKAGSIVKEYRPVHAVMGGWQVGDPEGLWNLYRLPELLASSGLVFVVEGEKACDAARLIGLTCTTSAHGAKSASKTDWTPLTGREVCFLPDNDDAGRTYAERARELCFTAGAKSVRILVLEQLGESEDIADIVKQVGQVDYKELGEEIIALALAVPPETTPPVTATTVKESKYYYDSPRKEYLTKNSRGEWLRLAESQIKKELANAGYNMKKGERENVSEADALILDVRDKHDVHYSGALAGRTAGFYEDGTNRMLITSSPHIIEPKAGDFSTIEGLLIGLLDEPELRQLDYLNGWIKVAYESFRVGFCRPGQMLAIAGPHDCGKSLLQSLITEILGGRVARPYQFMSGLSPFNSDLFAAEHLAMEDEQSSTDIRSRRNFGAQLKQITVVQSQRCHGKGRDAITLKPFWRISITINEEAENLMVLPPFDDSLEDKIILLRAHMPAIPFPTDTIEERAAYWDKLVSELPAYLNWLTGWGIPNDLIGARFGVKHFHHPDLLNALDALSPEAKLLSIIDCHIFKNGGKRDIWEGTAEGLEKSLTSYGGDVSYESKRLFTYNTAAGQYLGRLAKKHPARFQYKRNEEKRWWIIKPPITNDRLTDGCAIHSQKEGVLVLEREGTPPDLVQGVTNSPSLCHTTNDADFEAIPAEEAVTNSPSVCHNPKGELEQ